MGRRARSRAVPGPRSRPRGRMAVRRPGVCSGMDRPDCWRFGSRRSRDRLTREFCAHNILATRRTPRRRNRAAALIVWAAAIVVMDCGCGGGRGGWSGRGGSDWRKSVHGFDGVNGRGYDRHADHHARGIHESRTAMKTILALLAATCAFAPVTWAQIEQPRLGTMLSRDGSPWAVFGVAGSVTIGAIPAATGPASSPASGATSGPPSGNVPATGAVVLALPVVSMGCSRTMCLMKMESALVSLASSVAGSLPVVDAPAGPALFWFEGPVAGGNVNVAGANVNAGSAGNSALVYFPASRQLARWQNGQLSPVDFDVTGEILSIGEASDGTPQFAVRNSAGRGGAQWGCDRPVAEWPESAGPFGSTGPLGSMGSVCCSMAADCLRRTPG